MDVAQQGHDYFSRVDALDTHAENIELVTDFLVRLKTNSPSGMDSSLNAILCSFFVLLEQLSNDMQMKCLVFDGMAHIISCCADAISNIERLDKQDHAYLNKVFACLRAATDNIGKYLQDIGNFYEEQAK